MTETKSPGFTFYPGDFVRDTLHLTAEEIGCYWLLCCAAWVGLEDFQQGHLPNDGQTLANIARVTSDRWKKIGPRVLRLFRTSDDGSSLYQKRLLRERRRQVERSTMARKAANIRHGHADAVRAHSGRTAGAVPRGEAEDEDGKRMGRGQGNPKSGGFEAAFEAWRCTLPPDAQSRVRPTAARRRRYEERIAEGYSQVDIVSALTNYVHDPWPERVASASARDFNTLLRDGEQVEKFSSMRPRPGSAPSTPPRPSIEDYRAFARSEIHKLTGGCSDESRRRLDEAETYEQCNLVIDEAANGSREQARERA